MVRCPDGHFFDTAKHAACPWCAKALQAERAAAVPPAVFSLSGETRHVPPPPTITTETLIETLFAPPAAPPEVSARPSAVPPPLETTDLLPIPGASEPPVAEPEPEKQPGATKRLVAPDAVVDPVVGWLVCIAGADKGRDWRLHSERNFIGRSPSMDVSIAGDESISRDRHAILSFDPKRSEFWLQPGDATGLVYLHGEAIYLPHQLRERDTIEIGATTLVFLPFVSAGFQW
jgi:hypothetical protein